MSTFPNDNYCNPLPRHSTAPPSRPRRNLSHPHILSLGTTPLPIQQKNTSKKRSSVAQPTPYLHHHFQSPPCTLFYFQPPKAVHVSPGPHMHEACSLHSLAHITPPPHLHTSIRPSHPFIHPAHSYYAIPCHTNPTTRFFV